MTNFRRKRRVALIVLLLAFVCSSAAMAATTTQNLSCLNQWADRLALEGRDHLFPASLRIPPGWQSFSLFRVFNTTYVGSDPRLNSNTYLGRLSASSSVAGDPPK